MLRLHKAFWGEPNMLIIEISTQELVSYLGSKASTC